MTKKKSQTQPEAKPQEKELSAVETILRDVADIQSKAPFKGIFICGLTPDGHRFSTSGCEKGTEYAMVGALTLSHMNMLMDLIMSSKMNELLLKMKGMAEEQAMKGATIQ